MEKQQSVFYDDKSQRMADEMPMAEARHIARRREEAVMIEAGPKVDSSDALVPRRAFLRRGIAAAGLVATGAVGVSVGSAAPLPIPESSKTIGEPIPEEAYGMPIEFEKHVKRRRSDEIGRAHV